MAAKVAGTLVRPGRLDRDEYPVKVHESGEVSDAEIDAGADGIDLVERSWIRADCSGRHSDGAAIDFETR